MNVLDIRTFDQKSRNGGIWVLHDANKADRILRQALTPDDVPEPRMVPTKYIKEGPYLIIVQVARESSILIRKYHKRDTEIHPHPKTGEVEIYLTEGKYEILVESYDFTDERDKTEDEIIKEMVSTGYITNEEWEKYINPDNFKDLPVIKREFI